MPPGRILSGQTVRAFWHCVRHARPLAIGLNCALGAALMRPVHRGAGAGRRRHLRQLLPERRAAQPDERDRLRRDARGHRRAAGGVRASRASSTSPAAAAARRPSTSRRSRSGSAAMRRARPARRAVRRARGGVGTALGRCRSGSRGVPAAASALVQSRSARGALRQPDPCPHGCQARARRRDGADRNRAHPTLTRAAVGAAALTSERAMAATIPFLFPR